MIDALYDNFKHWSENGAVWIYSDPHFADSDLEVGVPNRPDAETQVKMINAKVGRKDTLIILGDIGDPSYAKQLRGYKVLIAGNHDAGLSNYEGIFDETYGGPLIVSEKLILSHEPINVDWAFNIHGHVHTQGELKRNELNVCSDVINYTPVNLNQFFKSGALAHIESIHRHTINKATKRKRKRGK